MPVLYRDLSLRRRVEQLPLLDASEGALEDRQVLRACALPAIVAQAYWYVELGPPQVLPEVIKKPWAQLRRRLGREQEVLSYIDLIVYNWRVVDASLPEPLRVDNLKLLLPTVDNREEHVFYLTQLEILAKASPIVRLVTLAQDAVLVGDQGARGGATWGYFGPDPPRSNLPAENQPEPVRRHARRPRRLGQDGGALRGPHAHGRFGAQAVPRRRSSTRSTCSSGGATTVPSSDGRSASSSHVPAPLGELFWRRLAASRWRTTSKGRGARRSRGRGVKRSTCTLALAVFSAATHESLRLPGARVQGRAFGDHRRLWWCVGGIEPGIGSITSWRHRSGNGCAAFPSAAPKRMFELPSPAGRPVPGGVERLTLDVSRAGVRYGTGDRCIIFPENSPELVALTLRVVGCSW